MEFLLGHCDHCGGNLYWDEISKTVTCLACAWQYDTNLTPLRRPPPNEPYHYSVSFKIPRSSNPHDYEL